jgi:hypothetical protein
MLTDITICLTTCKIASHNDKNAGVECIRIFILSDMIVESNTVVSPEHVKRSELTIRAEINPSSHQNKIRTECSRFTTI